MITGPRCRKALSETGSAPLAGGSMNSGTRCPTVKVALWLAINATVDLGRNRYNYLKKGGISGITVEWSVASGQGSVSSHSDLGGGL